MLWLSALINIEILHVTVCLGLFFSVWQAPIQEWTGDVPISIWRWHLQGSQWDGGHNVKGNKLQLMEKY